MIRIAFLLATGVEAAGLPALRVAFTIPIVLLFLAAIFIYRRRHQFFDPDLQVSEDPPVARHNRLEAIVFVWGGLTLVLLSIVYQLWFN